MIIVKRTIVLIKALWEAFFSSSLGVSLLSKLVDWPINDAVKEAEAVD